jgi:hypothetical protein
MAVKFIDSNWREALRTGFPPTDQVYLDFRHIKYPAVRSLGTEAYIAATSSANFPGTYALDFNGTEGYEYLLELPSKFSFLFEWEPTFSYDTASEKKVISWTLSATQFFTISYVVSPDQFQVLWQDGGTFRTLNSQQFDDGTSHTDLNQKLRFIVSIDLTTGTTAGSSFTVEPLETGSSSTDTTWSGNIDSKTSNFQQLAFGFRPDNDSDYNEGEYHYLRYAANANLTTMAEWKAYKGEEIYFPFDGHTTGFSRANVTLFSISVHRSQLKILPAEQLVQTTAI